MLAIGDPFGVGQTVTSGIVSALARTQGRHLRLSVLHPDRRRHQSRQFRRRAGRHGGHARRHQHRHLLAERRLAWHRICHSLQHGAAGGCTSALQGGKVQRPWFGASLQPVTSDLADSLGLDRPRRRADQGACTAERPGRPCRSAGRRRRHQRRRQRQCRTRTAFNYRFSTKGIGGEAELGFMRQGKRYRAVVRADRRHRRSAARCCATSPADIRSSGAQVANLSPAVAEELSIEDRWQPGVIIVDGRKRARRRRGSACSAAISSSGSTTSA